MAKRADKLSLEDQLLFEWLTEEPRNPAPKKEVERRLVQLEREPDWKVILPVFGLLSVVATVCFWARQLAIGDTVVVLAALLGLSIVTVHRRNRNAAAALRRMVDEQKTKVAR